MQPIIYPFGITTGLRLHHYPKYLPTAYDESMTLVQKMNKVIRHLDQIGETSNEIVEQWNQVMEWVLSEGVSQTTVYQLEQWLANGTLATVVNSGVYSDLNTKIVLQQETITSMQETIDLMNERLLDIEQRTIGV